ncbi:hypothetical protein [Aurantiacibacter sediminis]|uniref:DUF4126 domain-containing protein n=1 Tax=Aurantiacibacter sediminis TaxID=2793064 RepID=A0ABS0N0X2_9SPHN|nr:hypothetical protein [Aurantiacibacter sediminis]MBH5321617.1 hypothetical protein [Aurantiacibacter sediminis]
MPSHLKAFCAAVAAGTMGGGGPWLLLSIPLAIDRLGTIGLLDAIRVMLAPLLFGAPFALLGMLTVGLGATRVLHHISRESILSYLAVGAIGGAIIALLFVLILSGELTEYPLFAIFSVLGGAGASLTWGRHRMRLKRVREEVKDAPANPIHDLLF